MRVSVVICAYDADLYRDLIEAIESVLNQTYDDVEVVIVVDGTTEIYELLTAEYDDTEGVCLHCNDRNRGLSASRNRGIELATGDVIAFMDDDAVARSDWIERLIALYRRHDAYAAGGRMAPRWTAGKPAFLPEEFYWLIGVTHRGFPREECEVRNTFGSNISFRADVLEEVGGFDPDLGRAGESQLQGEETDLATRMRERYGEGVWYDPEAVVEHKVFEHRIQFSWLLKRSFLQGYTKGKLSGGSAGGGTDEMSFLSDLIGRFVPDRVSGLVRRPTRTASLQLLTLLLFTAAVGTGFIVGRISE